MAGLLQPQPGFNSNQFFGDALSGLAQGLLAYGAGGQARQQAGLIGLQGLQQAQQARAEQAYRQLQTQSLTQQMAEQQQQMQRQQMADQQAARQNEAYKQFLGGQPMQGPTPNGAPMTGKSPINPALANLPPAIQGLLPALDPSAGADLITKLATQKPQVPTTVGGMMYDETQKKFVPIPGYTEQAQSIAAASRAPTPTPSDIQEYQYAKGQGFGGSYMDYLTAKKGQGFTTTLPDGTVISMGGPQKPVTEAQATAGTRAQMIKDGVSKLVSLYNNPDISLPRTIVAKLGDKVDPAIGDSIRSGAEQQWRAAQSSALEGLASAVTGAGVSKDQFTRYESLLPQITDKTPEVKAFKLKLANDFLKQQLIAAGPAGKDLAGQIDAATDPSATPAAPAAPSKVYTFNPTTGKVE